MLHILRPILSYIWRAMMIRFCGFSAKRLLSKQLTHLSLALRVGHKLKVSNIQMSNSVQSPAIGIDLGTVNSCVAVFHRGRVEVIRNEYSNRTTPSTVAFTKSGQRLVGEGADGQKMVNMENTICAVKRLIGKGFHSKTVQEDLKWLPFKLDHEFGKTQIEGKKKNVSPEEVCAMILCKMKSLASDHVGMSIHNAVITVPATFNDAQRQAVKDCASISGLNVLQIMNESSAAVLAYEFHNPKFLENVVKNVLILELGVSNSVASVIGMRGDKFYVRSISGETNLGGEDFTRRLVDYCVKNIALNLRKDVTSDKKFIQGLRNACEEAKQSLSYDNVAEISLHELSNKKVDFKLTITRLKFEEICFDLFDLLMQIIIRALNESKLDKFEIHEIILHGGGVQMVKIQQMLKEYFPYKRIVIIADESVAYGAAIQAAILNGTESNILQGIHLTDVAPLSLGIEVSGGVMEVLIPANTQIPVKRIRKFTMFSENSNQNVLLIKVYEGESPFVKDNHIVGEFIYQESTTKSPIVHVCFEVDANGLLHVSTSANLNLPTKVELSGTKSRLPLKQIAEIKREVECFRKEDSKLREQIKAMRELKDYVSNIKTVLNQIENESNRAKVENKLNKIANFVEANPRAQVKEIELMRVKLDKLVFVNKLLK